MEMTSYEGAAAGAEPFGGASSGAMNEHEAATPVETEESTPEGVEGASQPAVEGGQPPQQPQGGAWDGKQFALKFRGQEKIPASREELINWAQLGYNYNNRKAQLDQREQVVAQKEEQYGQAARVAEMFEKVPGFQRAVYELAQRFMSGDQAASGSVTPEQAQTAAQQGIPPEMAQFVRPLLDEISQLKQQVNGFGSRFSQMDEQRADTEVRQEIDSLKGRYPDEDWENKDAETGFDLMHDILKHAHDKGFPSLEAAYRDLRWETREANIRANALKQAATNQQNAQKAGIVSKGGAIGKPTDPQQASQPNYRNMRYSELAKLAANEMKG